MRYRRPNATALRQLFFAAARAEAAVTNGRWCQREEDDLLGAVVAVYPRLAPPPLPKKEKSE